MPLAAWTRSVRVIISTFCTSGRAHALNPRDAPVGVDRSRSRRHCSFVSGRETYLELFTRIQPRIIRNEDEFEDFDQTLGELLEAQHNDDFCEERSAMVQLLSRLCEDWEQADIAKQGEVRKLAPAERLHYLLEANWLTQAEFGRKIDVHRRELSRALSGERGLPQSMAAKAACFFGLPITAFLDEDGGSSAV